MGKGSRKRRAKLKARKAKAGAMTGLMRPAPAFGRKAIAGAAKAAEDCGAVAAGKPAARLSRAELIASAPALAPLPPLPRGGRWLIAQLASGAGFRFATEAGDIRFAAHNRRYGLDAICQTLALPGFDGRYVTDELAGLSAYVPVRRALMPARDGAGETLGFEPVLPGYAFLHQAEGADARALWRARGFAGLVSFGGEAVAVAPALVARIWREEEAGGFDCCGLSGREALAARRRWRPEAGQWVRIVKGPFAEFMALVSEVVDGKLLKVEAGMLGGAVALSLGLDMVEAA